MKNINKKYISVDANDARQSGILKFLYDNDQNHFN